MSDCSERCIDSGNNCIGRILLVLRFEDEPYKLFCCLLNINF